MYYRNALYPKSMHNIHFPLGEISFGHVKTFCSHMFSCSFLHVLCDKIVPTPLVDQSTSNKFGMIKMGACTNAFFNMFNAF